MAGVVKRSDGKPRDRTLEIMTLSMLCLLKNQKLHIVGLSNGGRSRVKVTKVLPYGGERMEGHHCWPKNSYFKFRIHMMWLPWQDAMSNSLLFSSLSHISYFPSHHLSHQPSCEEKLLPAATGITHSDEKKTISGATGSDSGATPLQRGTGLDTHSATLQRALDLFA